MNDRRIRRSGIIVYVFSDNALGMIAVSDIIVYVFSGNALGMIVVSGGLTLCIFR